MTSNNTHSSFPSSDNEPPSYGAMGRHEGDSYNNLQDGTRYTGLDQTESTKAPSFPAVAHGQGDSYGTNSLGLEQTDSAKAPSFPALGHGNENSYNKDSNVYGGDSDEKAPSIGTAATKGGVSQTSEVLDPVSDVKAPNMSDVNRREVSQNATSSDVFDDGQDEEEEGKSVVRKNYRRLYPNSYYKEKDADDEEEY